MKEEYPAVSVVIVTYNSESNIDQCLKSLADTNYPSYEVIIADNKSTDRSLEIISNYAHSCTILKNEDNYGFAGGVNRAVTVAKGEYLVLLNPDCFVTPDWLTHLITPLKLRCVGATGATLLYPETQIIQSAGGSINSFGFTRHYGYRNPYRSDDKNRAVEYVTGAALATKKELFSTVGGFDEEYYPVYFEEIDYCRLLRNIGYHILYVPKAVVYHAESQSVTLNSDNYFYWYHRGRLRFISKQINGWVDQIVGYF
jgi:GT2 family glycosyltransferase